LHATEYLPGRMAKQKKPRNDSLGLHSTTTWQEATKTRLQSTFSVFACLNFEAVQVSWIKVQASWWHIDTSITSKIGRTRNGASVPQNKESIILFVVLVSNSTKKEGMATLSTKILGLTSLRTQRVTGKNVNSYCFLSGSYC
jgi:hypothetical protein